MKNLESRITEHTAKIITPKNVAVFFSYIALLLSFATSPYADKVAQSTGEIDGWFPLALFWIAISLRKLAEVKPINTYIGAAYVLLLTFLSFGY